MLRTSHQTYSGSSRITGQSGRPWHLPNLKMSVSRVVGRTGRSFLMREKRAGGKCSSMCDMWQPISRIGFGHESLADSAQRQVVGH